MIERKKLRGQMFRLTFDVCFTIKEIFISLRRLRFCAKTYLISKNNMIIKTACKFVKNVVNTETAQLS